MLNPRHALVFLLLTAALLPGCALFSTEKSPLLETLNTERELDKMPSNDSRIAHAFRKINRNLPYEYRIFWSPSQSLFAYAIPDGSVSLFDIHALDIQHAFVDQAITSGDRMRADGRVHILNKQEGLPAAKYLSGIDEPEPIKMLIIKTQQDSSAVIVKNGLHLIQAVMTPGEAVPVDEGGL